MADREFRGDAQPRRQVDTFTVGGTPAGGQTYTVTINLKDVTYTAGASDTNDDIAAGLQALLAAEQAAEFREVTWSVGGNVITATGPDDGKPFTATSTASGTGTLTRAAVTTPTGPNWVNDPENWTGNALPVDGDDVYFRGTGVSALYGLDAFAAVTPNTLHFEASFTGGAGLPDYTPTGYREYRPKYLQFNGVTNGCFVGRGEGPGSGRLKLDFGSTVPVTLFVENTGTPAAQGEKALQVKGSHASNALNATKGSIALAPGPGAAANFPAVRIGSKDNPAADVDLACGAGCTLGTVEQSGGQVVVETDVTTLTMTGGTYTQLAGTLGTATCDGGTVFYQSTGTLTSGTFRTAEARLDLSRDLRARTITSLSVTKGAALLDPFKTATFTNPVTFDRESLRASDLGAQFALQRS